MPVEPVDPAGPRGRVAIDYAGLVERLRQDAHRLVPEWLPNGEERGGRWYVGDFDGQPGESANVNLSTGQWIDNGGGEDDKGSDLLSLYARIIGKRNSEAALELIDRYRWERDYLRESPGAPRRPVQTSDEGPPPWDDAPPPAADEPPTQPGPAKPGSGERWRNVLPVPKHAPPPKRFRFGFVRDKRTGQREEHDAVKVWRYEFEGELFGFVARFERVDSKGERVKDTLPLTWCEDTQDPHRGQRWHWKQWAAPRPLYVPATLLSGQPADVPVVLVEGEKCAEAGHQLLGHEFDFVSWPGGCKAWALARWSWLMGRTVYLWPDADAQRAGLSKAEREAGADPLSKPIKPLEKQPGFAAMVGIGQELQAHQACTVYMVAMMPPGKRPDGWDLADAIAEGWTAADVRAYIRASTPFRGPDDAARAAAGLATAPTPITAAAGDGEDDPALAWRKYLLTSRNGAVVAARENLVLALDGWPDKAVSGIPECASLIRFNEFSNNIEKSRPTPWGTPAGDWLEADELQMGDWLCRAHYLPSFSRQALEEAVVIVSRRHAYHPLRQRIEGLRGQWDGESRLDGWLQRVCLEEDEHEAQLQQYLALAGRWFVMAMCARVMSEKRLGGRVVVGPGVKFDYMLVLEGKQAQGKSTFAATLGGDYFADTGLDIQHKDSLMNIQGVWVYEWSELESLTKQEVGAVKRFISSPVDRFRATFDRRPAKYPRQVLFIGTTNEAQYLTDTTGNRRFWPVRTTREDGLDIAWLSANLDQLLAEAVHRVDAGERFYPDRAEQRNLFDPQQRERTLESSLEAVIRTYLYDEHQRVPHGEQNGTLVQEISLQQLLSRVGYSIDKQTDAVAKKAGQIMHALGWSTRRPAADDTGHRPRVYVRPPAASASQVKAPPAEVGHPLNGPMQGPESTDAEDAPPF